MAKEPEVALAGSLDIGQISVEGDNSAVHLYLSANRKPYRLTVGLVVVGDTVTLGEVELVEDWR